jgi:hypothetical protein
VRIVVWMGGDSFHRRIALIVLPRSGLPLPSASNV